VVLSAAIVYKLLLPAAVLGGSIFGSKTTQAIRGPAGTLEQVSSVVKWGTIAYIGYQVLK